jgi:hypothetical protein
MPIDAKVEAKKLRELYKSAPRQGLATILLTGESGSGKTSILRTAPTPIHVDSFDPGGTKSVRDLIEKGDVIPDIQYENEDFKNPSAFKNWMREFEARRVGKYFNDIATYMLDSTTTFTAAVMNYIQASPGGSGIGKVPVWNKDYHPQKVYLEDWLGRLMLLPCHVILTAHLEPIKNDEGSVIGKRFLMTGKGAITIPLLFDEIWVADSKETSKGMSYYVKLVNTGFLYARSRLAANGVLSKEEPSDLRAILKKAGLNYEDKPKLY